MAIHVKEFEIDKFRGIDRLRIEGLNHVNLLLGDNNTGKTSVLECMRSICEPASFWNWHYVSRMSDRSGRSLFEACTIFSRLMKTASKYRMPLWITMKEGLVWL